MKKDKHGYITWAPGDLALCYDWQTSATNDLFHDQPSIAVIIRNAIETDRTESGYTLGAKAESTYLCSVKGEEVFVHRAWLTELKVNKKTAQENFWNYDKDLGDTKC